MKWSHKFIDIEKVLASGGVPEDFVARKNEESWRSCNEPLNTRNLVNDQIWTTIRTGDLVRVPLFPYCTFNRDPAVALAMAFQLGSMALYGFESVRTIHLAIGVPVEELDNYVLLPHGKTKVDCYRFWLGVAVQFIIR